MKGREASQCVIIETLVLMHLCTRTIIVQLRAAHTDLFQMVKIKDKEGGQPSCANFVQVVRQ